MVSILFLLDCYNALTVHLSLCHNANFNANCAIFNLSETTTWGHTWPNKIQMQALQYQIIPKTQFENTYLEATKTMQKSVQKCFWLRSSNVSQKLRYTWFWNINPNESVKSLRSFKYVWHQWNHRPPCRSWLGRYKNKVFLINNKKLLLSSFSSTKFGTLLKFAQECPEASL